MRYKKIYKIADENNVNKIINNASNEKIKGSYWYWYNIDDICLNEAVIKFTIFYLGVLLRFIKQITNCIKWIVYECRHLWSKTSRTWFNPPFNLYNEVHDFLSWVYLVHFTCLDWFTAIIITTFLFYYIRIIIFMCNKYERNEEQKKKSRF